MNPHITAAVAAAGTIAAVSSALTVDVSASMMLLVLLGVPFVTVAAGCFLRWFATLSPGIRADVLELFRVLRRQRP